jgi:hypothetical protein
LNNNRIFFLRGAGKYESRKFHVPGRCAGWLQGLFFYAAVCRVVFSAAYPKNKACGALLAPLCRLGFFGFAHCTSA